MTDKIPVRVGTRMSTSMTIVTTCKVCVRRQAGFGRSDGREAAEMPRRQLLKTHEGSIATIWAGWVVNDSGLAWQ